MSKDIVTELVNKFSEQVRTSAQLADLPTLRQDFDTFCLQQSPNLRTNMLERLWQHYLEQRLRMTPVPSPQKAPWYLRRHMKRHGNQVELDLPVGTHLGNMVLTNVIGIITLGLAVYFCFFFKF
ncbi:hypothetical protein ACKC9G_09205 [Pokkaliibacter sp. CJK22405]|uniref:hypothetical protein n=1 Tax=Pokkaliibacter sp. CJK22405 TaxID=3384615 RepID=UPI003985667A